jgi:hypothetical protein
MPRFRPRISLLTALLLMTVVCMAIVIVQLWREVAPLRAEVRRLRSETGFLSIDDPKKAYAITVPTFEEDTWKWRIYLPPGQRYTLQMKSGHFPPSYGRRTREWLQTLTHHGSGTSLADNNLTGEFTLESKLIQQDGRWLLKSRYTKDDHGTTVRGGGTTSIYPDEWLSETRLRPSRSDVTEIGQISFRPGDPILLVHRMKAAITESKDGWSATSPDGPADGFVLWIEAH